MHKTKYIKKQEQRRFLNKKALARYNLRPLATAVEDILHVQAALQPVHLTGGIRVALVGLI